MKSTKKQLVFLTILCLAILFLLPITRSENIHAATTGKRAKAIEAYRNVLLGKKSVKLYTKAKKAERLGKGTKFLLSDIDGNGIPELILEGNWEGTNIYTYKNGNVKCIVSSVYAAIDIFPKKHTIRYSLTGIDAEHFTWYKLSKGKLKTVAKKEYVGYKNDKIKYKYYIKGKKTTKAKYKKYVKKLKGKKLKLNLVENTETNRNLYLK